MIDIRRIFQSNVLGLFFSLLLLLLLTKDVFAKDITANKVLLAYTISIDNISQKYMAKGGGQTTTVTFTISPQKYVPSKVFLSVYGFPNSINDSVFIDGWEISNVAQGGTYTYDLKEGEDLPQAREYTVKVAADNAESNDGTVVVWDMKSETNSYVPTDRTRTKIGIGEELSCYIVPSIPNTLTSWTNTTGRGSLSNNTGNSVTFTASQSSATTSIVATVESATVRKDFNIVAPDGMRVFYNSDAPLWSAGHVNIAARTIFDCYVTPMDVSFYNVDFQENIPGDTWLWPDLSSGVRVSTTVPWGVNNNNKTSDTVSSDFDPIGRINNAGTYVDFSYNVRVPEEYKDDNGNWVSWFPGETHPREYRGSDQQARVSLNATNNVNGNWMGPWQ